MIQANELRLPSWVEYRGENRQMQTISHYGHSVKGNSASLDDEDLHPIPLTPEILEKCKDFEIDKGNYYSNYKYWFDAGVVQVRITEVASVRIVTGGVTTIMERITHLHELQNLFFALTGKELEVKF